jgi:RHS repeat-associated protein
MVTDYTGLWTVRSKYVFGLDIDEPLSIDQSNNLYYYHGDGLGSVNDLTDASGSVARTYRYDSFGRIISQTGTLDQPFAFTGREYDAETGLYYYRARYYDPKAGRFTSKDPIGFGGGDVNLFRYVGNDPVDFKDPRGLAAIIINLGNKPIKSSYSIKGGQQIFYIYPGDTSLSTTFDPDTLIYQDNSVVKVPDGSVVIITNSRILDTYEPNDLYYLSPLSQLIDNIGILPVNFGPRLIVNPEAEFGRFQCPVEKRQK